MQKIFIYGTQIHVDLCKIRDIVRETKFDEANIHGHRGLIEPASVINYLRLIVQSHVRS
jgi:hypothetical protein